MKMNIKTMAIAAVAVLGMTACAKDNGGKMNDNDGAGTVTLSLSEGLGTQTRAVAAPGPDNVDVTFNDGWVIFTNGADAVNKVVEIATGTYAADTDPNKATAQANGTKVWLGDMTAAGGSAINNVPAAASRVWIAGNLNGLTAPALGENIAAIKARTVGYATQNNATGNVNNVTLFGGKEDGTDAPAMLIPHPTLTNGEKYTKVKVSAVAARIELGSVVYENSTNFVTGFTLNGIFLNKYYPTMSLNSVTSSNVNNQPADATIAATMFAGGSTEYPSAASGALYDYNASGIGTAVSPGVGYKADGGTNVWAYNVLAPKTFVTPLTALTTPQLIVRLSNIMTNPAGFYGTDDQYLTVKTFKEAAAPHNVVTDFKPGYVYYITKLAFNESHLTPVPNQAEVIAYVEAVMMKWTRQEITGEF